ncbi:MAG TPA: hypothetical protein VHB98_11680 [Chloroflexota bacterium]|nr:hypothetical protein [Chloroflexota bacterium]
MSEEDALARLQRHRDTLELQTRHFVAQLATTWEDPRGLHDLLPSTDERFAGWVSSRADDLDALLVQVHHLRLLLSALEQAQ